MSTFAWAAFGLTVCLFCYKVWGDLARGATAQGTDLATYYTGATRLRQRLPLYNRHIDLTQSFEYVYPPPLAVLLVPFATLKSAYYGWALISIGSWIGALLLLWAEYRDRFRRMPGMWQPVLLISLINFPPLLFHLRIGQLQLVLLLLLTGCWRLLRHGKNGWAGVCLGLAAVLKIFPILLIVPLLLQGRRRVVLATVLTAIVLLTISFGLTGWEQAKLYVTTIAPEVNRSQGLNRADNLTAAVLAYRITGSRRWGEIIGWGLSAVVSTVVVLAGLRCVRTDRVFVLGVTALLLVTPVVWGHYFVLMYLPWIVALAHTRAGMLPLLIIAYCGMAAATTVYDSPIALGVVALMLPICGTLLLFTILGYDVLRDEAT